MAAARDLWRIHPFLTDLSLAATDGSRLAPASGLTAASVQKVCRRREGAGVREIIVAPALPGKNRAAKCWRKQGGQGFLRRGEARQSGNDAAEVDFPKVNLKV